MLLYVAKVTTKLRIQAYKKFWVRARKVTNSRVRPFTNENFEAIYGRKKLLIQGKELAHV